MVQYALRTNSNQEAPIDYKSNPITRNKGRSCPYTQGIVAESSSCSLDIFMLILISKKGRGGEVELTRIL